MLQSVDALPVFNVQHLSVMEKTFDIIYLNISLPIPTFLMAKNVPSSSLLTPEELNSSWLSFRSALEGHYMSTVQKVFLYQDQLGTWQLRHCHMTTRRLQWFHLQREDVQYSITSSNMESRGEHEEDTISHETDPYLPHIEYVNMWICISSRWVRWELKNGNLIILLQPSESFCCLQRESESTPKETGLSYHICSLIFLPSNSIVLILKSIPG